MSDLEEKTPEELREAIKHLRELVQRDEQKLSLIRDVLQNRPIELLAQAISDFDNLHIDPPNGVFTQDNLYYSDGDEKCPLMSERFLYPLFGKDQARSILFLWENIKQATVLG